VLATGTHDEHADVSDAETDRLSPHPLLFAVICPPRLSGRLK
jgi:hypothetical protein